MDYERIYKDALAKARHYYLTGKREEPMDFIKIIFPELQESEDEKIRKELIKFVKVNIPNEERYIAWLEKQGEQKEINLIEILKHYPRETELYSPLYGKLWLAKVDEKNEIITCYKYSLNKGCTRAILEQEETVSFYSNGTTGLPDFNISKDCMLFLYDIEKQGEKNPIDKVEPKFQEGDWVVNKLGNIWHIDSFDAKNYQVTNNKGEHNYFPIDIQDRMCLWTIQDAKDGDVLATSAGAFIYNGNDSGGSCPGSHCGISTLGRFKTGAEHHWTGKPVFPATKEQRDLLFQKMKEGGYEWDSEKKELKKIENRPMLSDFFKAEYKREKADAISEVQKEWSEEDENTIKVLMNIIRKSEMIDSIIYTDSLKEKLYDWLKSLKQRIGGE